MHLELFRQSRERVRERSGWVGEDDAALVD